ncbi:MAG: hypothetical protein G01um10145_871 [Microgenomates group bacterium Gr01-1014_5]|nr:MAG: hypothetical protein G01um10145_871 [Microgenomates group bacterium Gr01-1014_5]
MQKIDESFYNNTDYFPKLRKQLDNLEHPLQKLRIGKVLGLYKPMKSDRVLDLGCGWGTFSFVLAPICKSVTGLDFSKKSIDLCKQKLCKFKLKNVRFICADAQKTGLPAKSFDLIISADLFEHLYPAQSVKVIAESHRLLARGGKIVIWTPHRGHFLEHLKNNNIILEKDVSHVDYKSMSVLVKTLKMKGFRVLKANYFESHLPVLRIVERLLLPFIPLFRRRIGVLAQKI